METPPVRLGCLLFQVRPWDDLRRHAAEIEQLGFDELWVADHLMDLPRSGPPLEAWTTLAALAASTERVRLGTLVSPVTYHHPAALARAAITVDQVSGGRVEVGVGAGGTRPADGRVVGLEPVDPGERVDRLEEFVRALDALLSGGDAFEGRFYRSAGFATGGYGVQSPRPPILVAAEGPRALAVAAASADAWNGLLLGAESLDRVRTANARLDELAAGAGRDPASLRRTALLQAGDEDIYRRTFASRQAFADFLRSCTDAGLDGVMVYHPSYAPVGELVDAQRFARAVGR